MTLQNLMKAERKAYRALLNDPRVLADLTATHTPALKKAWEDAADAEFAYRNSHGMVGR